MSNKLLNDYHTLREYLDANQLFKVAGDQDIEHKDVEDQKGIGADMTDEINEFYDGVVASTPAAENNPQPKADTPPNCQDLNKDSEAALSETGTEMNVMTPQGDPASLPKTASVYRKQLAGILRNMDKKASYNGFRTGKQVMLKLASLTPDSTDQDLADAENEIIKLAATNPMFNECRERILMSKLAEDAEALAEAEDIPVEEAAEVLDEAAEADPSIMADAEDEATGEAIAELADAEGATDEMMGELQSMADGASEVLGEEVTVDDMMDAIDEVEAQAEAMGVPPEALIQEALAEISGEDAELSFEGEEPITDEAEADAEAILEEAAANGVSPEEVLQMAEEQLGAEDEPASDDVEAAECGEGCEKQASWRPSLAKTARARHVQNMLRR